MSVTIHFSFHKLYLIILYSLKLSPVTESEGQRFTHSIVKLQLIEGSSIDSFNRLVYFHNYP